MRDLFVTALFGIALGIGSTQAAEVVVKIPTPAPIVEQRVVAPSPQHVLDGGVSPLG